MKWMEYDEHGKMEYPDDTGIYRGHRNIPKCYSDTDVNIARHITYDNYIKPL